MARDDLDALLAGDDYMGADYEIVGGSDYMGADYEIVGAKPVVRRPVQKPLLEQGCPFPATTVATTVTSDITATPQRPFRTERLLVPSNIAPYFVIEDLVIGRDSMMVATGAMPAQLFSEVGVGVRLRGYTANLGNTIVLTVTNIDTASQTFRGGIIGSAIQ